ncbi:hypothetical protein ND856_18670 [Leptospira bandrabouensis]|uniref:hypothetical protein n=1 Tax=Leptospira bandrabouensis TaxID=2484903 RepID=UPI00223D03C0|nr:hypothetical protein [Leptospira bandrabouensis]MCW7460152.1 hypothetical protein [Leptospira bandrabouensis]MCW7479331.1 hypothetical protein [Leptospira bandrabouensis]MCW7487013.1 hypothetical protein [Leptospira bandrabouensis]
MAEDKNIQFTNSKEKDLSKYKENVELSDVTGRYRVIDRVKKISVKVGFHTEREALEFAFEFFEKKKKG